MIFNSFQFAGFFLLVWLVIAGLGNYSLLVRIWPSRFSRWSLLRVRNVAFIVAGYVFYAAWDVRFLSLLVGTTLVDFYCGVFLSRTDAPVLRKRILMVSAGVNIGVLCTFKYFDFFSASFAQLLASFGVNAQPFLLKVVLPAGISFYTFQSLSYTFDVYRRSLKAEQNLITFAAFVAFFPQLMAGPIERAHDLLPQFRHVRPITWEKIDRGFYLVACGLFKKVVIADNVAQVANAAFALDHPSGIQTLLGVYAFAFQIYCDFSGYTDIARGTAQLMGFQLSANFNLPYFATSPSDFWQRWHISLSSWLRDYLYIPLGGNRGSTAKTYRNLLLTMLLGGLWHGAAWTFVLWGAFHGGLLCVYRALTPIVGRFLPRQGWGARMTAFVAMLVFFQFTAISWLLFRAESASHAWLMLSSLWNGSWSGLGEQVQALKRVPLAAGLVALLLIFQIAEYTRRDVWLPWRFPVSIRALVYAGGAVILALAGRDGAEPFIYFQF